MMKRRAIPMALLALVGLAVAAPVPADAAVSDAVIIALNSIEIERESDVTGDVVVNETDPAPNLGLSGADLQVDRGTSISGDLYAETVALGTGVTYDNLFDGASYSPPIFQLLPAFRPATFDASQPKPDVFVGDGDTETLAAGQYGTITIEQGGTLVLDGGGYDVDAVAAVTTAGGQCPFPCRTIRFDGVTQLRVAGRFATGDNASIEADTGLFARDMVVYVAGSNADPSDPTLRPAAATVNKSSTVEANFYVPGGSFHLERQSNLTGSVIAFDAEINREAVVDLDSAFNFAPVADDQTVFSLGADPLDITLTATDADGDDLEFTLASGPSFGTLTGLAASDLANPTAAVTVTYDADVEGASDSFVFMVDDGKGGTDLATVDINPSDDPPPPPTDVVVAKSQTVEALKNADTVIFLEGASPPGFALAFSIVLGTGPSNGTLSGITVLDDHDAEVTYSPDQDFVCAPLEDFCDSFEFEVSADLNSDGDTADPGETDIATVRISISDPAPPAPPVALDQSVTTGTGGSVTINLVSPANTSGAPDGRTCTQDSDCATGFICDSGSCVEGP